LMGVIEPAEAPQLSRGRDGRRRRLEQLYEAHASAVFSYARRRASWEDADEELVVDGFLMPAVADRHVHIELSDPAAVLRHGVTAVRDLAWPPERIFPLADASEMPSYHGPLIRAAGAMLTGHGGYPTKAEWAPAGTGRELTGPDDAVAAVADLAGRGATAIKVSLNAEAGPTPTDPELMAICDEAHRLELPVTAHAQGAGQVERALGAGFDELAHAPWTRLSDEVIETAAARLRIVSRGRPIKHRLRPDTPLQQKCDEENVKA